MLSSAAVLCLALNIYHEARGEPIDGQIAVAAVTLNRVHDPRWPDNVCDVVYQPHQFSWTLQEHPLPIDEPEALLLAFQLASEAQPNPDFGTHYHSTDIDPPSWTAQLTQLGQVGIHRFYQ